MYGSSSRPKTDVSHGHHHSCHLSLQSVLEFVTMSLDNGIVLPGITRESLMELLEKHAAGSSDLLEGLPRKVRVVQRDISMPEIVAGIADGSLKA